MQYLRSFLKRRHLLSVKPHLLDIGRLEINHEHSYYFKLTNRAESDLDYQIIIPEHESSFFKFGPTRGTLTSQETRRVYFTVLATNVGRHAHSLVVRDTTSKAE